MRGCRCMRCMQYACRPAERRPQFQKGQSNIYCKLHVTPDHPPRWHAHAPEYTSPVVLSERTRVRAATRP